MTSVGDVRREIKQIILKGIENGRVMPTPWVVTAVLAKHPVLYDPAKIGTKKCDSAFAELARHHFVSDQVRHTLRLFKKDVPDMPLLPGYSHLQLGYLTTVEHEDDDDSEPELIISPIEKMSDDQLREKAKEYRSYGAGCYAHADEIDRYLTERDRARAA